MQIEVRYIVPNNTNGELLAVSDQCGCFLLGAEHAAMSYIVTLVVDLACELTKLLDAITLRLAIEHWQQQPVNFPGKPISPSQQLVNESGVKLTAGCKFLAN